MDNKEMIREILGIYTVEEIANGLAEMVHERALKDIKDETIENLKKALDITHEVYREQERALLTLIKAVKTGEMGKDIETIKATNLEVCKPIETGKNFLQDKSNE